MHDFLRNANHWRDRAEETRAKAERFAISKTEKERLLRIRERKIAEDRGRIRAIGRASREMANGGGTLGPTTALACAMPTLSRNLFATGSQ